MTLPSVQPPFGWTIESWGPALRCGPLQAVAPHVFTTRRLRLSEPDGYGPVAAAVGALRVRTVTQVHGREVAVERGDGASLRERLEADAIVSASSDAAVAIRTADCVPLLMADAARGVVAAVHAGWRGTAAGVTAAAVAAMVREFGSRPADLVAAIGPCIGACCYEVGAEVVDAFAAAGHEPHVIERWFTAAPSRSDALPAGAAGRPRVRLDLAGANRDQLLRAGVSEDRIYLAGLCTAEHLDVLTSYRAERHRAGRLVAAIRASGSECAP